MHCSKVLPSQILPGTTCFVEKLVNISISKSGPRKLGIFAKQIGLQFFFDFFFCRLFAKYGFSRVLSPKKIFQKVIPSWFAMKMSHKFQVHLVLSRMSWVFLLRKKINLIWQVLNWASLWRCQCKKNHPVEAKKHY